MKFMLTVTFKNGTKDIEPFFAKRGADFRFNQHLNNPNVVSLKIKNIKTKKILREWTA